MLAVRRVKKPCPGCQSLLAGILRPARSSYHQHVRVRLGDAASLRLNYRLRRTSLCSFSSTPSRPNIAQEDDNSAPKAEESGESSADPTPNEESISEEEIENRINAEIDRVLLHFEEQKGAVLTEDERKLATQEIQKAILQHLLAEHGAEHGANDAEEEGYTPPGDTAAPEDVVKSAREVFKDTLPKGYLTPEEQAIYYRLYGEPIRETTAYDVGMPLPDMDALKVAMKSEKGQNVLLRESGEGHLEEVEYIMDPPPSQPQEPTTTSTTEPPRPPEPLPPSAEQVQFIQGSAKNEREYEALLRLQKDFEAACRQHLIEEANAEAEAEEAKEQALAMAEEKWDKIGPNKAVEPAEEFTKEDIEAADRRTHKYTDIGKFKTSPKSILIPAGSLIEPITELLQRTHVKHVRETAEASLGGPGLPYSPAYRRSKHGMFPQLPIGLDPGNREMSEIEADAFISTVLPFNYAIATSALTEVRKRMGADWIPNLLKADHGQGPRVLDIGTGGAGAAAWEDVLKASWNVMRSKGEVEGVDPDPHGRKTVIVGNDSLRHRISRFLHNTSFLPRMPDYVHSKNLADKVMDAPSPAQGRKVFDLIIAGHMFMPYSPAVNKKDPYRRDFILENLWSLLDPNGGVLVVFEKGHPRGFEEVAAVRQRLLDEFMYATKQPPVINEAESAPSRVREPGRIIAPCTNHVQCPMYKESGNLSGRKDFCHFKQRFIRPHFLQRILNARHYNHEDVQYSYISVQRGVSPDHSKPPGEKAADAAFAGFAGSKTPPNAELLPRNILQPLKRTGHVTMDLCTPAGQLERWTVPRSFGKQAYHDARKARWGDLWALGAKTRVHRKARLGRKQTLEDAMLMRDYTLKPQMGPDGKERMVLPEKAQEALRSKKNKKSKYVQVPRTSRHNRKVEFDKEVRDVEKERSRYAEVKDELEKFF
ncbi:uncharacterized protein MKZ38_009846 [Zalerion maritima]|uniref:Uncharacterized protein n=1 Tax=Zalerion maritima TaxID=339359 RepID=A0AAD5RGM1_9PEZI|nr:uncharacterized protein MKZ38_009846 [Zalerion maritima]